ncbi:zinc finger, CCHC-type containing protein [Tanacetum coccineum]
MNDNESINDFAGKISGIVAKFKSLGSTLEEEVIVRKFLNSVPKKYLPIVAPIEQYSDLETMPFEEAVGRVKAYEERLQSLEAKDEDQGQLMMASEEKHGENSGRGRGRRRNSERGGRGRGRGRGRGDKSGIRCYNYGEFGHFSYECTKWKDKDEANLIQDEEPALL